MAKTKISEFSATPGNNTDIDSINIAEGCAPSGINDAIRELMAQLKDFQTGAVGDSFNGPVGTTTAAAGAFTTLAASGAVTLSGGTANGVPYLNGSKVLTSGSALVFDGTNLGIGTSSPGAKLHVAGTGAQQMLAQSTNGGQTSLQLLGSGVSSRVIKNVSGALVFEKDAVDQATLDSSGNLGLGVTPSAWFSTRKVFQAGNASMAGIAGSDGYEFRSNAYLNTSGSEVYLNNGNAALYASFSGQHRWYTAPSGTAGNAISFTQAMTLDASGNLLVGTTSSGTGFQNGLTVNASNLSSTSTYLAIGHANGVASGNSYLAFLYNGGVIGSVTQNGTTQVLYNVSSDHRLKDITGPVTGTEAKDFIMALQPKQGTWKADDSRFVGFVAHEFQEVSPLSVTGTKDAVDAEGNPVMQAMQASSPEVMANLIAHIQNLEQRLAALEAA